MTELKRIGVLSAAKISAALELVYGLAFAVLLLLAGGAMVAFFGPTLSALLAIGLLALIAVPLLALAAGFVGSAIGALVYNAIAGWIGGVKVELKGRRLARIGAVSLGKFALVAGALVGLVSGIAASVAIIGTVPASSAAAVAAVAAIAIVLTVAITAAMFAIGAMVGVVIYNAAASVIGGVVLDITKGELRGIGIAPYAKMAGLLSLIEGLFIGVMYAALGSNPASAASLPSDAVSLGAMSIVAFPLAYLAIGVVCAAVGAWLYNGLAKRIGGVALVLK